MRRLLILLLLASLASADFLIERVDVTISDIGGDGSARVHESIKFIMLGNYSMSVYDSGVSNNELSFWSTNIGLKDVKFHVNTANVEVRDLRLRPQPRTKCNPIQGICHGELVLDYLAYPTYANNSTSPKPLSGTGLFSVDNYKPRTKRFTINPSSLSFTTTPEGSVILDKNVYLTIKPPSDSTLLDINPKPEDFSSELPARPVTLSWTDIVLVKFSLVFDTEEGIDKEVSDFFSSILKGISDTLSGPHGFALLALAAVLLGSYLYITMAKRRGEE
jgi:hypothetical protein